MELVAQLHQSSFDNVNQVQKKQHKTLCCQGRMVTLCWFQSWGHSGKNEKREKMKKLGKKKSLLANWEMFVGYKDEKGN